MQIEDRPTDMLQRQLQANRLAARGRDKHGRKLFCHLLPFRPHFVREIIAMRRELRSRKFMNNSAASSDAADRSEK